jgi:DNA-binding transcriptional LysR family regulator
MQQFIERAALLHGGKLQVRLRVPSFEALYRLVAAGAGLGVLPEAAALRYRSAGQPVTIVEFRDRWAERELKLCARDFVSLSPLQQTFVAFLTPA